MKNLLWKIPEEYAIPEPIHRAILLNDETELSGRLHALQATDRNHYRETIEKLNYLMRDEVRFYWDFRFAAANYFTIVDKEKNTVPLVFNDIQERLFRTILDSAPIRRYVLKSRKFGCSTFTLLLYYWDCLTSENATSVVIAHEYEASERLFKIVSFAHDHLADPFKAKTNYDNRRELLFDELNSYFFVGSAQKKNFGRSDNITNLLMSELAFWPDAEGTLPALFEAVPGLGNMVAETTPESNSHFRKFHADCKAGEGAFDYTFFRWFDHEGYQLEIFDDAEIEYLDEQLTAEEKLMMKNNDLSWEQMKFWLEKRQRLKSMVWQEYPPDDLSCFLVTGERAFFDARKLQAVYLSLTYPPIDTRENEKILIYEPPTPGESYIIAADTSKGIATGSRSAAVVLRIRDAVEVAELWGLYSPVELAHALTRLGEEYNWALIAVEENNHGHSTLNTLKHQRYYPNLYYHVGNDYEEWLHKHSGIGIGKKLGRIQEGELGWPTTPKTRPIMFNDLREEVINEGAMVIRSKRFVEECMALKEKDGEIYSDDLYDTIIARAIAWQVRKRMRYGTALEGKPMKRAERSFSPLAGSGGGTSLPWETESSRNPETLRATRNKRSSRAGWEL